MVEGYTDVIQMFQSGVENVVSSSGTALTPDQIRLINRLTKNITVLFDGDAAGLRASLRGIDLILEQGMNVRVCSFPPGEDPDSFARRNSREDLLGYLEEHAKDFIQFKTSLLTEEAAGDPIKRADTIRDIVQSISKIPDQIQQQVYLQECAKIMDIPEEVLFNSLAQMNGKMLKEAAKKRTDPQQRPFEVVKTDPGQKVDVQYELERKIIELLLLYGEQEQEFEDLVLKENEAGQLVLEPETVAAKVYEKVYLDLQEDEIELSNPGFRTIYYKLMEQLNGEAEFSVNLFLSSLDRELLSEVSSILMEEERYELHNWERRNIFPKGKEQGVAQLVGETILTLRCNLIRNRIEKLQLGTQDGQGNHAEILEEIVNYQQLNKLLNAKLNRVIS